MPIQLNNAMFSLNGRSGYVLKPKCMRMMKSSFSPSGKGKIPAVVRESIKLSKSSVLAGDSRLYLIRT